MDCSADPRGTKITVTTPSGIRHAASGGGVSIWGNRMGMIQGAPTASSSTSGPRQPPYSRFYVQQGTSSTRVIDANTGKIVSRSDFAVTYSRKIRVLVAFVSEPRDSVTHMSQDRFSLRPEIGRNLLELLRKNRKESRPIQDAYSQVKQLLHSTPDLLEEFEELIALSAVKKARTAKADADEVAGHGNHMGPGDRAPGASRLPL